MAKTLPDGTQITTGDVVLLDLDPTRGSEMRKTRPCLLVEAGKSSLPLVIVLPITDDASSRRPRLFVPISDLKQAGLSKPSAVDCYQIRSVSLERVQKRLGSIDAGELLDIRKRLALVLDIGEEHVKELV